MNWTRLSLAVLLSLLYLGGVFAADTDGDGISDAVEGAGDFDGDGVPDFRDLDSDNDGLIDAVEFANALNGGDTDGDGFPDWKDLDSDGDGISDTVEAEIWPTPVLLGLSNGDTDNNGNPDNDGDGILDIYDCDMVAKLQNGGFESPVLGTGVDFNFFPEGGSVVWMTTDSQNQVEIWHTGFNGVPSYAGSQMGEINANSQGTLMQDISTIPGAILRWGFAHHNRVSNEVESMFCRIGPSPGNFNTVLGPSYTVQTLANTGFQWRVYSGTYTIPAGQTLTRFEFGTNDADSIGNLLDGVSLECAVPSIVNNPVDTDGDSIPDYIDSDSDGDTIPDSRESNPLNINNPPDTDGDGIPDWRDLNSDGDSILDKDEAGPNPANPRDSDGDGIFDFRETDSDNDGMTDTFEAGGNPATPLDTDGDGLPDFQDSDSDNDGINDRTEAGPNPSNPLDSDGDGRFDFRDVDSDNDGVLDSIEGTGDNDGDGVKNYLDLDSDNDGIFDAYEAMTSSYLDQIRRGAVPNTVSAQGTHTGAVSSNGLPVAVQNGINAGQVDATKVTVPDSDGDTVRDYLDLDSDNDGINDLLEAASSVTLGISSDGNGNGRLEGAVSPTGTITSFNYNSVMTRPDSDADGIINYRDVDTDNDGILDSIEGTADNDGDGVRNFMDLDSDNDGIFDAYEAMTSSYLDQIRRGVVSNTVSAQGSHTGAVSSNGLPVAVQNGINAGQVDPSKVTVPDTDGDTVRDYLDLDSDNDLAYDLEEAASSVGVGRTADGNGNGRLEGTVNVQGTITAFNYNSMTRPDTDSDRVPDYRDLDSDNDGLSDLTESLTIGTVIANVDSTNDGMVDGSFSPANGLSTNVVALHALVTFPDSDGDSLPNFRELDSDGDGVSDNLESQLDPNNPITPSGADSDSDGTDNSFDSDLGRHFLNPVDSNGDGLPDYTTPDSDGDGIGDGTEGSGDPDGDGLPNKLDLDSDGDGIPDSVEYRGGLDSDGDGAPDYLDGDSDNDGIPDWVEASPDPAHPIPPTGRDTDGDGIDDAYDADQGGVPNNNPPDSDRDGVPDYLDPDSDNDGIPDYVEGSDDPLHPTPPSGRDTDGDGVDDSFDPNQGGTPNDSPPDSDGDGKPNYLDGDSDNDGVLDWVESSPTPLSPTPPSGRDTDGDGVDDSFDPSQGGTPHTNLPNTDGDSLSDYLDGDSDNDGILDNTESSPDPTHPVTPTGVDSDGDGVDNAFDGPYSPLSPPDSDGDGRADFQDRDSDNDGILDNVEASPNPLSPISPTGSDSDGDGIDDAFDGANSPLSPPDHDSDGKADFQDKDSDNDGILDSVEASPDPLNPIVPSGTDSDRDGIDDAFDGANSPLTPTNHDGDSQPDFLDGDSDNDGIPDNTEGSPDPLHPRLPTGVDSDGDGVDNAFDGANLPLSPPNRDGDSRADYLDGDSDNDGLLDSREGLGDPDGDGIPNFLDLDSDGDGLPDYAEASGNPRIPTVPTGRDSDRDGIDDAFDPDSGHLPFTSPPDFDRDGVPDYLDPDSDNDGLSDLVEAQGSLTPTLPSNLDVNHNGLDDAFDSAIPGSSPITLPDDKDGDGRPNHLDLDSDDDGVPDWIEGSVDAIGAVPPTGRDSNGNGIDAAWDPKEGGRGWLFPVDTDGDGVADQWDLDSDNDGVSDLVESGLVAPVVTAAAIGQVDANNDGVVDSAYSDSDGDGVRDPVDPQPSVFGAIPPRSVADTDGDSLPDFRDLDSNGDGSPDLVDLAWLDPAVFDPDGDGRLDPSPAADRDRDGINDLVDENPSVFGFLPVLVLDFGNGSGSGSGSSGQVGPWFLYVRSCLDFVHSIPSSRYQTARIELVRAADNGLSRVLHEGVSLSGTAVGGGYSRVSFCWYPSLIGPGQYKVAVTAKSDSASGPAVFSNSFKIGLTH